MTVAQLPLSEFDVDLTRIRAVVLTGFTAGLGGYTINSIEFAQTCGEVCRVVQVDDYERPGRFNLGTNLLGQPLGSYGMAVSGLSDR